jgi:transcriptional regulator with XRE-family HTH domain
MSFLVYDIGGKSRTVARFMGTVRRELQKAVAAEKQARKLTQQQIADMLDTSRSVINREILGGNLTLRRLAELAWALGWEIVFEFRKPAPASGQNQPLEALPELPKSNTDNQFTKVDLRSH